MNFPPITRVACLGLVFAFVLSSCGADDPPSLGEVRKFDAYRVYYAGKGIAGFPLEAIEGEEWQEDQRSSAWVFFYGRCDPPPTGDSGCAPPLQIHSYSTCNRWAGAFNQKLPVFDFRGAKARGGTGFEKPLEIFTGRTTVTIFSEQRNVITAAGRELRNVRQAQPSRLPPPVPGSLEGKLPCQDKPS